MLSAMFSRKGLNTRDLVVLSGNICHSLPPYKFRFQLWFLLSKVEPSANSSSDMIFIRQSLDLSHESWVVQAPTQLDLFRAPPCRLVSTTFHQHLRLTQRWIRTLRTPWRDSAGLETPPPKLKWTRPSLLTPGTSIFTPMFFAERRYCNQTTLSRETPTAWRLFSRWTEQGLHSTQNLDEPWSRWGR